MLPTTRRGGRCSCHAVAAAGRHVGRRTRTRQVPSIPARLYATKAKLQNNTQSSPMHQPNQHNLKKNKLLTHTNATYSNPSLRPIAARLAVMIGPDGTHTTTCLCPILLTYMCHAPFSPREKLTFMGPTSCMTAAHSQAFHTQKRTDRSILSSVALLFRVRHSSMRPRTARGTSVPCHARSQNSR